MSEQEAKERRGPVVELRWTTEDYMNQARAQDVAKALGGLASEMMAHTDEYEVKHRTIIGPDENGFVCYSVHMKRVKE